MRTLLVGMGNPILSDDAVGVRLARDFKAKLGGCRTLDVMEECSVGGLNLIDVFAGYDRVIVLDSLQTTGGTPGDWYSFTAAALQETIHLTNIHDANFATALALGRTMGINLPELSDITIFGVEVRENRTFSESMSPELEGKYACYSAEILEQLRTLLRADAP
jgi:hydrogenase maturation protease